MYPHLDPVTVYTRRPTIFATCTSVVPFGARFLLPRKWPNAPPPSFSFSFSFSISLSLSVPCYPLICGFRGCSSFACVRISRMPIARGPLYIPLTPGINESRSTLFAPRVRFTAVLATLVNGRAAVFDYFAIVLVPLLVLGPNPCPRLLVTVLVFGFVLVNVAGAVAAERVYSRGRTRRKAAVMRGTTKRRKSILLSKRQVCHWRCVDDQRTIHGRCKVGARSTPRRTG